MSFLLGLRQTVKFLVFRKKSEEEDGRWEREKFASRLRFILISAGCSIGLGGIWRFLTSQNAVWRRNICTYLSYFYFALGLPIMTMEFAVGRASQKSIATSFKEMQREGQKWHWMGYAE